MSSIADAPAQIRLADRPPVYAISDGIEVHPGMFRLVPPDATFADLCPSGPWLCHVSGEWISRADWWQPPRGGDVIVFCRVPHGRDGLRTLLTLAVIVASVYTGGLAGGGFYGALASAAVSVVGTALVSALVPLDAENLQNSTDTSSTYSVQLQGNQAKLEQVQPVLYGYNKTFPDYACQPYYRYANVVDQYLFACLQVGLGQYKILRVSIDDTPLDDFESVEYAIVGPGQTITTLSGQSLVQTNVITATEVSGQTMVYNVWVGPFVATAPQQTATVIEIDIVFPYGLMGPTPNYNVGWQVQARPVNDFEQAIGPWKTLAQESYAQANDKPIRLTYTYNVPEARYQVRTRRITTRTTNPAEPHDIAWAGLRCTLARPGVINNDATFVCVKIRASEQLNNLSARRISVLSSRLLPAWSAAGGWTAPQVTRNPAWAAADVLRNSVYGRAINDAELDIAMLKSLADEWEARQDHFDFVFDTDNTTWDALATVLRVGRAVPLIRGMRYTAVRDSLQTLPVAGYSMTNIKGGSFQLSYTLPEPDEVDCIRLEYQDLRLWDTAQAVAQVVGGNIVGYALSPNADTPAGTPEPANSLTIQMPGIRGMSHALREAAYRLADLRYRRRSASWTSEMDGRLPAYGSLVSVAHDVPDWGQSGALRGYDEATLTAYTTEPLDWSGTAPFFIRLQLLNGGLTPPIVATPIPGVASACRLATSPGFKPVSVPSTKEPTRYLFGPSTAYGADCRVKALKPTNAEEVALTVVLEDPRVHAADAAWLPVGGAVQDPISDGATNNGGGPDPFAGDPGAIVTLTAFSLGAEGEQDIPTNPRVEFTLRSDGVLAVQSFGGHGVLSASTIAGQWLNPQPIAPAIAATYEARATALTVIGDAPEGPMNTWLSLSTSRTWAIEGYQAIVSGGGGDSGFTTLYYPHIVILKIEIRDRDGIVQGSARVSMAVSPAQGSN